MTADHVSCDGDDFLIRRFQNFHSSLDFEQWQQENPEAVILLMTPLVIQTQIILNVIYAEMPDPEVI